ERVCSICGARHNKRIKDDWHPPYHGRCRCTEVPDIPDIGESIDAVYEAMFGDLLDEFAQDEFGVNLR
ncbi:MAG: minor head protein, partial [Sporolactobacillus laevolacticus]|nr:minor head protein [Sporolactobacillus laevolacticus]